MEGGASRIMSGIHVVVAFVSYSMNGGGGMYLGGLSIFVVVRADLMGIVWYGVLVLAGLAFVIFSEIDFAMASNVALVCFGGVELSFVDGFALPVVVMLLDRCLIKG
jgi:hypothetical protein